MRGVVNAIDLLSRWPGCRDREPVEDVDFRSAGRSPPLVRGREMRGTPTVDESRQIAIAGAQRLRMTRAA